MLVLTRMFGESLRIGSDTKVTGLTIDKNQFSRYVVMLQKVSIYMQESISIRDDVIITVVRIDRNQFKLGIETPDDVTVNREEYYNIDLVNNVLSSSGIIILKNS